MAAATSLHPKGCATHFECLDAQAVGLIEAVPHPQWHLTFLTSAVSLWRQVHRHRTPRAAPVFPALFSHALSTADTPAGYHFT